MQLSNF